MKLVVFGLTISSSWGNGHATIWRALCKALSVRGHRTVFFERDVPYYSEHRDTTDLPGVELCLYDGWGDAARLANRHLKGAEAAIVTSYCPDAIAATDLVVSSGVGIKAFYDLDTPVTLRALEDGLSIPYVGLRGLKDFDVALSYTGGAALDGLVKTLGARRSVPLYGSVDPEVHRPVEKDERFRAELSYLGTYAADRQALLYELFIGPAKAMPGRKFVLGGSLYPEEFPWNENIFYMGHVSPPEHQAFYSSSRFTLNITRSAMANMGYCPSGRLFEAAACGAPVLSDAWEGLDCFFDPGLEIRIVRSREDVAEALDMPESERLKMARAARERALEEHCALNRAKELEDIFSDICAYSEREAGVCGE